MSFFIYDNRGYRVPFHPGDKWRTAERIEGIGAFDEKSRQQEEKEGQGFENQFDEHLSQKKAFQKRTVLVASQIMSRPVITLYPEDSLKKAWTLFDMQRFRHVPIINHDKKIVGLLSDRILLHETAEFSVNIPQGKEEDPRCVKDIMNTKVLCAQPNTDITHIAKIFIDERIGAVPITGTNGEIEGILTRSDILRTIIKVHALDLQI